MEQLIKEAVEQFETQAEKEAFLDGLMEKVAFTLDPKFTAEAFGSAGKGVAGLGIALAGAALATGIYKATKIVSSSELRTAFFKSLAQVMNTNKIIKASPEKARQYAETIFKFAPNVAGDPNLLSSILSNVIQGEGVDAGTIKALVDLEGRYLDNNSPRGIPSFGRV
jgi:hypothetical protein